MKGHFATTETVTGTLPAKTPDEQKSQEDLLISLKVEKAYSKFLSERLVAAEKRIKGLEGAIDGLIGKNPYGKP